MKENRRRWRLIKRQLLRRLIASLANFDLAISVFEPHRNAAAVDLSELVFVHILANLGED